MVARSLDELERRDGDRVREAARARRRHHGALGAGDHVHRAAHVAEERERVDRLGGEDAAVPPRAPAAVDGLDPRPARSSSRPASTSGARTLREPPDDRVALRLDALLSDSRTLRSSASASVQSLFTSIAITLAIRSSRQAASRAT